MENWTPEQIERAFKQTMIWANIAFYIILTWIVLLLIWYILDTLARQKYIKKQNEHDKAVITNYQNTNFKYLFNKKTKQANKDFQMNLTGLENKWNNLDQNTQCGIYAKVYKYIKDELNKNESKNTTNKQN